MALTATLQFGDNSVGRYYKEYLVTDFKCHVCRTHNQWRPDGNPKCDRLELSVVAPGKEDLNLFEWYADRSYMSGRIIIELSATAQSQSAELKEVLFENGVCYSLAEEYRIGNAHLRTLRLSIAAESLTVDSIHFQSIPLCP